MNLDSKIPEGPLSDKWDNHRFSSKLVNPANKRKFKIIVVGSGLAGGSAALSQRSRPLSASPEGAGRQEPRAEQDG